ncbi:MAG: beta-propeller domain-containing protein [Clostridia bacterium]|nr:beta-propeller domain-containing protein [Clostridia bacterium]
MLRENYRRANDNIHAREELLMEMQRKQQKGTNYKWIYKVAAGIAACLVLCGGIIGIKTITDGAGGPTYERKGTADGALTSGELLGHGSRVDITGTVDDYDELYKTVETIAMSNPYAYYQTMFAVEEEVAADAVTELMPEPNATGMPVSKDTELSESVGETTTDSDAKEYSETNVQVRGVDEADIVKTDGDYIYTLSSALGQLFIVEVGEGYMMQTDSIAVSGGSDDDSWNAIEFYVFGDRLHLIYHRYETVSSMVDGEEYWQMNYYTGVAVFDVSNRSDVIELARIEQSGTYRDSRLVDGYLYLVSNYDIYDPIAEQIPTYCPVTRVNGDMEIMPIADIIIYDDSSDLSYTVVTSIDAAAGMEHSAHKALLGSTGTVYCNHEHILLADAHYESEKLENQVSADGRAYQQTTGMQTTKLTLFDIDAGSITEVANAIVEGTMLNQFSIDEYNGFFRMVVTLDTTIETIYTDGIDTYEWDSQSENTLYVLDAELNQVGKIDNVGQDERVYSVRFDGDIGYFVTFRQTDPLFAVDLSDPYNPVVLSALKIPGFSSYLHSYGEGLLLGIGYDADEETGWTTCIKLSMFDVSDKTDVTEAHTLILDEVYWSEATQNHKAILIDVEKNLIAFPAENVYYIYAYEEGTGFVEKGRVDYVEDDTFWYYSDLRGLYIEDVFYVVASDRVIALSLESFEVQNTLMFE